MNTFVHTITFVSHLLNSTFLTTLDSPAASFLFSQPDSTSLGDSSSLPNLWQMSEKRKMSAKFLLMSLRDQFKLFTIPLSIGIAYISYQKFRHLRNQNRFRQPITNPEPQLATGIEVMHQLLLIRTHTHINISPITLFLLSQSHHHHRRRSTTVESAQVPAASNVFSWRRLLVFVAFARVP
jgi:hypothetical protein